MHQASLVAHLRTTVPESDVGEGGMNEGVNSSGFAPPQIMPMTDHSIPAVADGRFTMISVPDSTSIDQPARALSPFPIL